MKHLEIAGHVFTGLTEAAVAEKQKQSGFNELPPGKKKNILLQFVGVLKEPMFLLLLVCGLLYLVLGDVQEGIMLLGFVLFMIGIEYYQERKTGKALDALRELTSPRARVIREAAIVTIPSRELVVGDLIVVDEGERVPADCILMHAVSVQVDESLLTGESVPVRKIEGQTGEQIGEPGGDDTSYLFSGTLLVQGNGVAEVVRVGKDTSMGRIGSGLLEETEEPTRLKTQLNKLIRNFALGSIGLCFIVVVVFFLVRGDLLHGFLAGLTLAMAILPEEFPVILTVFLALGAWRMSRQRVLARKPAVIETLGSATVLCTDKTGTLTQNRMKVQMLHNGKEVLDFSRMQNFPEAYHEIIEYGILSSQTKPNDPMEKAICGLGEDFLQHTEHLHNDWNMVREYPLTRELLAMSRVFAHEQTGNYVIAAKGAPESIFDLCHLENTTCLEKAIQDMASQGLRVLGVARATVPTEALPDVQHDFEFEFVGLIGLSDPIRPEVKDAVRMCHEAGIKVVMITGDYPVTAQNIGREVGLEHPESCITGPELNVLTEEELVVRLRDVRIFARIAPEQKLKIVRAFKSMGEVVAMTGDGVNDAPALKAAHIGIAMGERGTDVAREASSLILTDDNFASIVGAVRMGRRIFDNMQNAFGYVFAVHIPIAGLSMIPVFLAQAPLLFFPVHVVFMELIIDPACSVIFEAEPESERLMKRSPRGSKYRFFGSRKILMSCLQGFSILLAILGLYSWGIHQGWSGDVVRTTSFVALIVANLLTILINRSWDKNLFQIIRTPNPYVKWIIGGALVFLLAVTQIPFLQSLFQFAPLSLTEVLLAGGTGLVSILWFELYKVFSRK